MAWNDIIDEIRKYTNPEGLVYLQVAQNEVDPVDKALRNGDLKGVVTIIRKLLPYLRSLVPHVNNAGLQKSLTVVELKNSQTHLIQVVLLCGLLIASCYQNREIWATF